MSKSLGQKLSTDIGLVTLLNVAQKVRSFLIIPLIVGSVGIGSYGFYIQLMALVSMLCFILSLGAPSALVRFVQKQDRDDATLYSSILSPVLFVSGIGAVSVFLLSDFLSVLLLRTSDASPVFAVGSVLVFTRVLFQVVDGYFRSRMETKTASILLTLRMYLSFASIGISLYLFETGIFEAVLAMVIAEIILNFVLQFFILSTVGLSRPRLDVAKEMLSYSLPMAVGDIASNLSTRVDRLLVGSFFGADAVGVYDIAYRIASVVMVYPQPISRSLFPEFSRLIENGKIEICVNYTRRAARYYTVLIIPSIFGLGLVGDQVVGLVADGTIAEQTTVLVPLIAAGLAFWGIDHIYSNALFASEKTVLMMKIRSGAAVLNICLNIILIPALGVVGAAAATLCSYFVAAVVIFIYSNRIVPAGANLSILAKSIIAGMTMYGFAAVVLPSDLVSILVVSPIVYFGTLLSVRGIAWGEIKRLGTFLSS